MWVVYDSMMREDGATNKLVRELKMYAVVGARSPAAHSPTAHKALCPPYTTTFTNCNDVT